MSDEENNLHTSLPKHNEETHQPVESTRQVMLGKLVDMSSNTRPLNIRFSKENNMQDHSIKITVDGDDIQVSFEDGAHTHKLDRLGKSTIIEIDNGLELTQFYDDGLGEVHKITLIILSPENEPPGFFYYIVHDEPKGQPTPPTHDDYHHGHSGNHPHSASELKRVEARRVYKLTHMSSHGGGRD